MTVELGTVAPDFALPDTDGRVWRLSDGERTAGTVVVFTCNHCPYALAWHDRIVDVANDYTARGIRFFAINPNDAERYPGDSIDAMRARLQDASWPMPYLRDEDQTVAAAFGASTTPDIFVLDPELRLRYRGAPDSAYDDPSQRAQWVRDALEAVLAGNLPAVSETKSVGCSVKWKPGFPPRG